MPSPEGRFGWRNGPPGDLSRRGKVLPRKTFPDGGRFAILHLFCKQPTSVYLPVLPPPFARVSDSHCCVSRRQTVLMPVSRYEATFTRVTPEGRPGMSDVSPPPPCLESQGCHLIPLCHLLSCSSAWSCCSFCLVFSACWSVLLNFVRRILQYFSLGDGLFCLASVWQRREVGWSVMCAACCRVALEFAVVHLWVAVLSGIDKSTEWSTIPACPCLMCFFFLTG